LGVENLEERDCPSTINEIYGASLLNQLTTDVNRLVRDAQVVEYMSPTLMKAAINQDLAQLSADAKAHNTAKVFADMTTLRQHLTQETGYTQTYHLASRYALSNYSVIV